MDMFADTSVISSVFMNVGHSLRFEITFALVLFTGWCVGKFARLRQQSRRSAPLPPSYKPGEKKLSYPASKAEKGKFQPASPAAAQMGRVEDIDPSLLRDPSWLVPQVMRLCRVHLRQSLALYRAALEAGLSLQDIPVKECQLLFEALVTSSIRTGSFDDAKQLLQDLQQKGPGVSASLFCSATKLCTSKHLCAESLAVYEEFVAKDPDFVLTDKTVWSCLLFCAIETKSYSRCNFFFDRLKDCGTPSTKDYGNMVRLASVQGDGKLSLKLIQEMQEAGIDIDSVVYNMSLATCVGAGHVDEAKGLLEIMEKTEGLADVITYNTLMKFYSKSSCMDQCLEIFERLKSKGIVPSQVTYGILLDGLINDGQLERAAKIFNTMMSEGGIMNTVLFTTLIKGFARTGDVDQAMKVYQQMHLERNVTPDLITFSILIKANCDADRLEEALKLLEAMTSLNLKPDEVVFNNLLAGCTKHAKEQLGKRLYVDMVASGVRPSNATFSILIRFFHECKNLGAAVEMLKNEPAKHKIQAEPRLFLQLIQSCIRARQGQRAVEVYALLVENSTPTAPAHSSMITTCLKLNMFETAAEILATAAARNFPVDARDANALLDSAVKKRKMQTIRSIAASIAKLGLPIDPKLLAAIAE